MTHFLNKSRTTRRLLADSATIYQRQCASLETEGGPRTLLQNKKKRNGEVYRRDVSSTPFQGHGRWWLLLRPFYGCTIKAIFAIHAGHLSIYI